MMLEQKPRSSICAAALVGVLTTLSSSACELKNGQNRGYEFAIRVTGDPGHAVPNAVLTFKSQPVAKSSANGLAKLSAQGQEGETLEFGVTCPDGYRSPASPLAVRLTRLGDSARMPEYQITCAPALRNVVIAVRAENGGDLPVKYLGKEVAHTDATGAAHFLLRVEPGSELEVELDTKDRHALKPQNPTVRFLARSADDLFVFDQPFVVTRDARHVFVTKSKGPVHF